jgi:hypothetical protein
MQGSIIKQGNINQENQIIKDQRGWIFGHFVPERSKLGICKNRKFEVHWGKHKEGNENENITYNNKAYTFVILIKGKFSIILYKNKKEKKEYILKKEGDFILFGPKIPHDWRALKNTLTFTIRWPSIPNDQTIFIKKKGNY